MCNAHNHPPGCMCGWGGNSQPFTGSPWQNELSTDWIKAKPGTWPPTHPLTFPTVCWWCEERIFVHTNGNGDTALLEPGVPWLRHQCLGIKWMDLNQISNKVSWEAHDKFVKFVQEDAYEHAEINHSETIDFLVIRINGDILDALVIPKLVEHNVSYLVEHKSLPYKKTQFKLFQECQPIQKGSIIRAKFDEHLKCSSLEVAQITSQGMLKFSGMLITENDTPNPLMEIEVAASKELNVTEFPNFGTLKGIYKGQRGKGFVLSTPAGSVLLYPQHSCIGLTEGTPLDVEFLKVKNHLVSISTNSFELSDSGERVSVIRTIVPINEARPLRLTEQYIVQAMVASGKSIYAVAERVYRVTDGRCIDWIKDACEG